MSDIKTLKEKYSSCKKDVLKHFAEDLGLRKISSLNKADLIDCICSELKKTETMFYRMAILDDRECRFFESAINATILIDDGNYMEGYKVEDTQYAIVDSSDQLTIPAEIVPIWNTVKSSDFDSYRRRASWVWKCLNWCEQMYGCFPSKAFHDVINTDKGMHMAEDELISIFDHFPLDQMTVLRLDNAFISFEYIRNKDDLKKLHATQSDKPYYIPTVAEINELYRYEVLTSDSEYQNMRYFLHNDIGMDENDVNDILCYLFEDISVEGDPNETLQWFLDKIIFDKESQAKTAINLFTKLSNGTRMIINRGHKPSEIAKAQHGMANSLPTIVAGSSTAANMLSQIAPEIRKMGFGLDLDCNATTMPIMGFPNGVNGEMKVAEKKIYPNDPCPCGSGKKYKKCCGRNQ